MYLRYSEVCGFLSEAVYGQVETVVPSVQDCGASGDGATE